MFARTERLLLRPGWLEDAPALTQALSDPAIIDNLGSIGWPFGIAEARRYLARANEPVLPNLLITQRTPGGPELVGGVSLHRHAHRTELEFWIARAHWGKGFATEAGRAVLDMAAHALALTQIVSLPFVHNPAAVRVLEKLGFAISGRSARRSIARNDLAPAQILCRSLRGHSAAASSPLAA